MAATDFGLNGRPRSFKKPCAASSADMARRLSFPPLGFLRPSAFASLTASGRASWWLLRPSTFAHPVSVPDYQPRYYRQVEEEYNPFREPARDRYPSHTYDYNPFAERS